MFCFDLDTAFSFKSPDKPYRMGTYAQALALIFYEALLSVFVNDAVRVSFVYIGAQKEILKEDIELLSALLEEKQLREEAEVLYQEENRLAGLISERHKPYIVYFFDEKEPEQNYEQESIFIPIQVSGKHFESMERIKKATQKWIKDILNSRLSKRFGK